MERFQSRPSPAIFVVSCRSISFVTLSGRLAALNMLDMSEDVTPRALTRFRMSRGTWPRKSMTRPLSGKVSPGEGGCPKIGVNSVNDRTDFDSTLGNEVSSFAATSGRTARELLISDY